MQVLTMLCTTFLFKALSIKAARVLHNSMLARLLRCADYLCSTLACLQVLFFYWACLLGGHLNLHMQSEHHWPSMLLQDLS